MIARRAVVAELDLRPGKLDPAQRGQPGGTYPFRVVMAAPGRAVQLRLQTASGGTLRHGEQQQTIAPGVSVVRLLAQPQPDGLLQFSWSTGQGHAQATLGVLAAEQEQE